MFVLICRRELNGGESLQNKRKKYANLITPNLLTMDFSENPEIRIQSPHELEPEADEDRDA